MKEKQDTEQIHDKYFFSHSSWKEKRIESLRRSNVRKNDSNAVEKKDMPKSFSEFASNTTAASNGTSYTEKSQFQNTVYSDSETDILEVLAANIREDIAKNSKKIETDISKKNKNEPIVFTISTRRIIKILNVAIVLICLTGAFFSARAYYNAVNASFEKLDEEPIGTIVYKYKVAQRKMTERLAWDRVKQHTPIYNGDLVRTAELSEATITFIDGTSIDLFGQTLTQVFYDEEGVLINFSGGDISVSASDSQDGVRFTAGETEVDLATGAVLSASSQTEQENGTTSFDNSSVVLQLREGDAHFVSTNGGEQVQNTIEVGNTFLLDPIEDNVAVSPLTLLSPAAQVTYIKNVNETLTVPFVWEVQEEEIPPSTLEISDYKDFYDIADEYTFEEITDAAIPLETGAWHWRFLSEESESQFTGKVTVLETRNAQQIAPREGEEYVYRTKTPSIRFVWSEDENVLEWIFEIADNEDMQNPSVIQTTRLSSSIIHTLSEGTWYWRVTPRYSPRHILSDEVQKDVPNVQSFSIVQHAELLPAIQLAPVAFGFIDTQNAESPQFVWKHDREAVLYTISISKYADLSEPILTEQTTDTFFALDNYTNNFTDGIWYWSVSKTDAEGSVSPTGFANAFYAISGDLVYETISPKNAEVFTEETIQEAQFVWENNVPFKTMLQVSQDATFSTVLLEEELDTSTAQGFLTDLTIPAGEWYWRTLSKEEDSETEYATEAKHFFVDFTLGNVLATSPRSNTTLKTHGQYRQTFAWQRAEHADYYNFALYSSSNKARPVFERTELTRTEIQVDMSDYQDGQYEWQVQAFSYNTPSNRVQESNVAVRTFSIDAIKPVELTGLSESVQIDAISALVEPQSVGWSSSEEIVSSEFVLSKTNHGLTLTDIQNGIGIPVSDVVMRVPNPAEMIQLDPLNEGTYYWTVLARTADDINISAIQPRIITVLPLASLPSVSNMVPNQFAILQNSDILKGFIDFSWTKVDNADEYHFILYDQNQNVLWEKILLDENTVRFENISLLDRGVFTWAVEARKNLPNNTVQRGMIATNSFTIDIGTQIVPQDKTQRGQYGF